MSSKMSSAPAAVKRPFVERREKWLAPTKPNTVMPARARRDARHAVLDDEASFGADAHRARRVQEKIGTRLSLRDLGGGKNIGREQVS